MTGRGLPGLDALTEIRRRIDDARGAGPDLDVAGLYRDLRERVARLSPTAGLTDQFLANFPPEPPGARHAMDLLSQLSGYVDGWIASLRDSGDDGR
jgi:hypothetical protein